VNTKNFLVKHPSSWFPVAMSFAALLLVIGYVMVFGVSKQEDEGTAAHIFQLLLVGQVPIIAFFAFKWFPKKQKQVLQILAIQFAAGLLAFAIVFFLEL